jgi:DNA repair protein RadA/Sms
LAKVKTVFSCSACGHASARWLGRCPQCEAWNTFVEETVTPAKARTAHARPASGPVRLSEIAEARFARMRSGFGEFDALLGGGLVAGSLVLLGGPPGAGKSTLLLQIINALAERGASAIYVCGEESAAQTKLRAARIGATDDLLVFPETNLRAILDECERRSPDVIVIDSIQTMALPEVESFAGSVSQVRDCTQALMEFAKRTGCAVFIVGHVTKDGAIAGPRLLEHLVDTVLYFEGDSTGEYRIVRAYKNRFGGVDEICVFSMDDAGLHEITDPSALFLAERGERPSGSCVVPSVVGSRPVLVEVQALVGETSYGTPRRLATNVDAARLTTIVAILERRAGMQLGGHDIYRTRRRPWDRTRDRLGLPRHPAGAQRRRLRRTRPLRRSAQRLAHDPPRHRSHQTRLHPRDRPRKRQDPRCSHRPRTRAMTCRADRPAGIEASARGTLPR